MYRENIGSNPSPGAGHVYVIDLCTGTNLLARSSHDGHTTTHDGRALSDVAPMIYTVDHRRPTFQKTIFQHTMNDTSRRPGHRVAGNSRVDNAQLLNEGLASKSSCIN